MNNNQVDHNHIDRKTLLLGIIIMLIAATLFGLSNL